MMLWTNLLIVGLSICPQLSTANNPGVLSCSWDQGLCGWRVQQTDTFKWKPETQVRSHAKTVLATPNSVDDSFLWASGASNQLLIHKELAVITSVPFYNPGPGALRFWHVSDLSSAPGLYVNVTQNGVTTMVKRFQNFAPHWTQRIVNILGPGVTTITIAAAPVGHGIDEIEYTREAEIAVFREVVIPFERPVVPDALVSCSFSNNCCGWDAFPGMAGEWNRIDSAGQLPTGFIQNSSNPWSDAWFLSVQRKGDDGFDTDAQAAIVTREFPNVVSSSWLQFWWAKYEASNEESAIFVRVITSQAVETVFHSKLPTDGWVSQNVSIPQTGPIRIVIGFQLTSQQSIGALDEVLFSGDLISKGPRSAKANKH